MDRKAWNAAAHGVTKSWTRLSKWTELRELHLLGFPFPLLLIMFWFVGLFCTPRPSCCWRVSVFFHLVFVQLLSHVWLFVTPRTAYARLFCPPLSPRVCSDSCPLSPWHYLTISSSGTLFSFYFWSFPAPGFFPVSLLFISGGQIIAASAWQPSFQWIFRVDFFRINWFDLLISKGILKSLLQHHNPKLSILWHSSFFMVQITSVHHYQKNDSFDCTDLGHQSDVSAF